MHGFYTGKPHILRTKGHLAFNFRPDAMLPSCG